MRTQPHTFLQPATLTEVQHLVRTARGSVRTVGAGHSFTPVAAGTETMVNLDKLSGIVSVDTDRKRVRFLAGTRLRTVPGLLAPFGLALANQGDVDPQSLAGAVSTSTHGTGLGFTGYSPAPLRRCRLSMPPASAVTTPLTRTRSCCALSLSPWARWASLSKWKCSASTPSTSSRRKSAATSTRSLITGRPTPAVLSHNHYRGTNHGVFVSPRRVRFHEMEYAVPLAEGPAVVREIRSLIDRRGWRIGFPLELRTTAADDVALATSTGRESMYIATHVPQFVDLQPIFAEIEPLLRSAGGRLHWGQDAHPCPRGPTRAVPALRRVLCAARTDGSAVALRLRSCEETLRLIELSVSIDTPAYGWFYVCAEGE